MGKKDRCAVFRCNNDRFFPEKYTIKFSFARKARVNTERVPPRASHSHKFNTADVSLKRFIFYILAVSPGSSSLETFRECKEMRLYPQATDVSSCL